MGAFGGFHHIFQRDTILMNCVCFLVHKVSSEKESILTERNLFWWVQIHSFKRRPSVTRDTNIFASPASVSILLKLI